MNAKQKAFLKLDPAKQRVAIAKDVIKQMAARKIKPRINYGYIDLEEKVLDAEDSQVCDILAKQQCTVCALGAMMVTAVQRANKLKVKDLDSWWCNELDYIDQPDCLSYLGKFFPSEQLDAIEAAFEGWDPIEHDLPFKKRFAPRLRSATARMTAVMENIVKNKGTFVWPESP